MKKALLTIVVMLGAVSLAAQGVHNVRINEVLVINEDNYIDDYGHRSSWIELFNAGYEAVDVGACYLGATKADGTEIRYIIPKGDSNTKMGGQSYLVFFCEGTDTKGTFYTSFKLDDVVKITLYTANNKTVIDEFAIDPSKQVPDVSIGYLTNDAGEVYVTSLPRTTPNATNENLNAVPKHELFRQQDPRGGVMAIIAMSVVFIALVLIFLILKGFGAIMMWSGNRRNKKEEEIIQAPKKKKAAEQVQEELAVIALAIKMYQEDLHINESTVITINRVNRVYSPWSSKIHGIPPIPNKKNQ